MSCLFGGRFGHSTQCSRTDAGRRVPSWGALLTFRVGRAGIAVPTCREVRGITDSV